MHGSADPVLVILYLRATDYTAYCLSVYRLGTAITLFDLLCFPAVHMCCSAMSTIHLFQSNAVYRNAIAVLNGGANNKEYIFTGLSLLLQ